MSFSKKDFPIFKTNPKLVYLDSAASSLKPRALIDRSLEYYQRYSANIFRGIYPLSEKATAEYEKTRLAVARFINARREEEVVFTRNATESLNLLAYSLVLGRLKEGDAIVTTVTEHHANFVPWQQLAIEFGLTFKIVDINEDGHLLLTSRGRKFPISNFHISSEIHETVFPIKSKIQTGSLEELITKKTKVLALTHVSNVLGTINPVRKIVKIAKRINPKILVVLDAAQSAPHLPLDVQDLGCDFLAFSAHKMLGPTGVGVLWGRQELLDEMRPFNYGGEMIKAVRVKDSTFELSPHRFEAGTPDIAGVIAFRASLEYLQRVGLERVREHEVQLLNYARKRLTEEFGGAWRLLGPARTEDRGGVMAFTFKNFHSHDIGQILADQNVCIRAGHHCAMPLHERLGLASTARASFYLYNNLVDVEKFITGLKRVDKILG